MKRILSVILAIVMAFGCFAISSGALYVCYGTPFKTSYNATTDAGKKIMNEKYEYGSSNRTYYNFDTHGNLIKKTEGNYTTTYTYNSNNYLTKKVEKDSSGNKYTTTYTYNSKGYLTKEKSSRESSPTNYSYNSKGQLTQESHYGSAVGATSHTYYYYNSKGLLTKENMENVCDGGKITLSYDEYGRLIKEKTPETSVTCSYSNGKPSKESRNNIYNGKSTNYIYYSNGLRDYEYEKFNSGSTKKTYYYYTSSSSRLRAIDGRIRIEYTSATYTGSAKRPNVAIDDLQKGKDYRLTYSNNVKPGTAKVKITFLGSYATQKPVTISFKIKSSGSSSSSATYYKTTSSLNLRKGPGTSYSTILTMPSGAKVKYLGSKSNGFCKVSYTKSGKTYTGWCSSSYLKKV